MGSFHQIVATKACIRIACSKGLARLKVLQCIAEMRACYTQHIDMRVNIPEAEPVSPRSRGLLHGVRVPICKLVVIIM